MEIIVSSHHWKIDQPTPRHSKRTPMKPPGAMRINCLNFYLTRIFHYTAFQSIVIAARVAFVAVEIEDDALTYLRSIN
jgi:hypothetical protein